MVLESLINPWMAEKKPYELLVFGLVYTTIAIFASMWVFREYSSMLMVFLTVMAVIPLLYKTFKLEEEKDRVIEKETTLLKEHSKVLAFLLFLFVGITLAFAVWYVFLPSETVQVVFSSQINTISAINNKISGNFLQSMDLFKKILFNNIKVLVFCILFAFFYGVGAIFILTWNASVIGAAIGNFVRVNISKYVGATGLVKAATYFHVFSLGILRYAIHGIPEIAAYFIGGIAGAIISFAVINHDFRTKAF